MLAVCCSDFVSYIRFPHEVTHMFYALQVRRSFCNNVINSNIVKDHDEMGVVVCDMRESKSLSSSHLSFVIRLCGRNDLR